MAVLRGDAKMQVLFGHLDARALDDVVSAFQGLQAACGQEIIVQGDAGDCLYIIDAGVVDIFVRRGAEGGRGSHVARFGEQTIVGELALMYETPRAATVAVASPEGARVWALDREAFKMLLAQTSQQVYARYEGWLCQVDVLKTLNHYELSRLSECLEVRSYGAGEAIVRQGEMGDCFFILEEGSCDAYISGPQGDQLVKTYNQQGEYFGELALIQEEPRRATVLATGAGASVVSLSKGDFTALLGPIQDLMKRHADLYPQYNLG